MQALWIAAVAGTLVLAGCASSNLPENYRSQTWPGAIDCTPSPEAPMPASCRNLYENAIR
jgi:hypothetical protein